MQTNIIHNQNCLRGMKELPENSIDLMVTDPPYGISFMGKQWDKAIPSIDIWKETLRILKPGAFAFIMCIPRQDCLSRMIISLEDAGFNINFTSLYWCYASGFPKAQNISKTVDKKNGRFENERKKLAKYLRDAIKRKKITFKDLRIKLRLKMKGGGLIPHWITKNSQPTVPIKEHWVKLKSFLDLDNSWDWYIERTEAERKIIFSKGSGQKRQNLSFSNGLPIKEEQSLPIMPQAKALNGSYAGFQPKPALEVILVAMKPLSEKSYVNQAMKNRKGIVWFDDCRIPYNQLDSERIEEKRHLGEGGKVDNYQKKKYGEGEFLKKLEPRKNFANISFQGRFPANILVSNDILNNGKIRKSSNNPDRFKGLKILPEEKGWNQNEIICNSNAIGGDSGSFSRYFSLDAWWNEKLKNLPDNIRKIFPFLIIPKASKSEKNRGCEDLPEKLHQKYGSIRTKREKGYSDSSKLKNNHPTCKPIKLMSYLITLGSRSNDIILDPFIGSGTTAIACKILNRRYIGYEINKEYCEITKKRLKTVVYQGRLFE